MIFEKKKEYKPAGLRLHPPAEHSAGASKPIQRNHVDDGSELAIDYKPHT